MNRLYQRRFSVPCSHYISNLPILIRGIAFSALILSTNPQSAFSSVYSLLYVAVRSPPFSLALRYHLHWLLLAPHFPYPSVLFSGPPQTYNTTTLCRLHLPCRRRQYFFNTLFPLPLSRPSFESRSSYSSGRFADTTVPVDSLWHDSGVGRCFLCSLLLQ